MSQIFRNANVTFFLPSGDEWFKAAFYKGGGTNAGYWTYPTKSDALPSNVLSAIGTNNENYSYNNVNPDPSNLLTPVGYFAGSPGPYGTYDMGGDIQQWTEWRNWLNSQCRDEGGNAWGANQNHLATDVQWYAAYGASEVHREIGFRVAGTTAAPEPGSITLLVAGLLGLAGIAFHQRRRGAKG